MTDKSKQRARSLSKKTGMSYQAAHNIQGARKLPKYAGFSDGSRLFFRPFALNVACDPKPALRIVAEIRDGKYLVEVLGQQVVIEPAEIHQDRSGLVAVLRSARYPLRDGFELDVHAEVDDPLGPGWDPEINGMITIRREGTAKRAAREAAEERFGPVNLVMADEFNASVYFEADGTAEDWESWRANGPVNKDEVSAGKPPPSPATT